MGLPNEVNSALIGAAAAGDVYEIQQSLRFNNPTDGHYLNRTPSTAGNRRTFTYSGWHKFVGMPDASNKRRIFSARSDNSDTGWFAFIMNPTDDYKLEVQLWNHAVQTDGKLRDFSAWYHIVLAVDTTQATATDRVKIYLNGVRASMSTRTGSGFDGFTQNLQTAVNNTTAIHNIGTQANDTNTSLMPMYAAEIHFVDGTALDQYDFGEFDDNGVWRPINVRGLTYGTNGYYLNFSNSSDLGEDQAGSNDWTGSVRFTTSGTGTDVLSDTPTNNFCTWNPIAKGGSGTYPPSTLSDGNLRHNYVRTGVGDYFAAANFAIPETGNYYWEVKVTNTSSYFCLIGVCEQDWTWNSSPTVRYVSSDGKISNSVDDPQGYPNYTAATYGNGDVIGCAWNGTNKTLQFYKNGTAQASPLSPTVTSGKTFVPCWHAATDNWEVTINCGQRDFEYAAPSGYDRLCTADMPSPGVTKSTDNFVVSLDSGDQILSPRSIITAEPEALTNNYTIGGAFTSNSSLSMVLGNLVPGGVSGNFRQLTALNNDPQGSGGNSPDTNWVEFDTAIALSGTCFAYHGNGGGGTNPVNVGGSMRITYSDGTSVTSTTPNAYTGIPAGSKTLGDLTADNAISTQVSLNNTKSIRRIAIGNNMTGRFGSGFTALDIGGDFSTFTNNIDVNVADGSIFSANDIVFRTGAGKSGLAVYGKVTSVAGNVLSIDTVDDWQYGWEGQEVVLWSSGAVSNFGPFGEGLIWIKDRQNTQDHQLLNDINGSSLTWKNPSVTVGAYSAPSGNSVSWSWKEGAAAGFDIVTYTGNDSNGRTVSHNLGVVPELVFVKSLAQIGPYWYGGVVKHKDNSSNNVVGLNASVGQFVNVHGYVNDLSSSTTITLSSGSSSINDVNANSVNYVAYLWASVEGFSKISEYTGNGNSWGPMIALSFAPAMIFIKKRDADANWVLMDQKRYTYNPRTQVLYPSATSPEVSLSGTADIDFLSNGFKIRSSWDNINANNATYLFAAFAKSPFGGDGVSPAPAR